MVRWQVRFLVPVLAAATIAAAIPARADIDAVHAGIAAVQEGAFEDAIRAFTQAIDSGALDPETLAIAYNNRGVVYDDLGDFARAIADYENALAISPNDETTLHNLAIAHAAQGHAHANLDEHSEAIAAYGRALDIKPDDARTLALRALAHEQAGDIESAILDAEAALRFDPDHAEARAVRSRLVSALGAASTGVQPSAPAAPAPGDSGDVQIYVTVQAVNFRAGPGNEYERLGTFDRGTRVRVVGAALGWMEIERSGGDRVYVFGRFLEPAS